jgi:hypothetical protein
VEVLSEERSRLFTGVVAIIFSLASFVFQPNRQTGKQGLHKLFFNGAVVSRLLAYQSFKNPVKRLGW